MTYNSSNQPFGLSVPTLWHRICAKLADASPQCSAKERRCTGGGVLFLTLCKVYPTWNLNLKPSARESRSLHSAIEVISRTALWIDLAEKIALTNKFFELFSSFSVVLVSKIKLLSFSAWQPRTSPVPMTTMCCYSKWQPEVQPGFC